MKNWFSLDFFCINSRLIRGDPYWTSGKNSLELIVPSCINIVSLVKYLNFATIGRETDQAKNNCTVCSYAFH